MKIYRILGRDGSATIPFALRKELGFRPGDVVCFERMGEGILVRKEKLLEMKPDTDSASSPLEEFLEGLSARDQYEALVHLSVLWAERQEGKQSE